MIRKIALAILLLAFCVTAPALAQPYPAPDKTYYANPWNLDGGNGLKITVTEIVASDTPIGSYGINYPPSVYRYYVLYYMTDNPNDFEVPYQYKINLVDTNGNEYGPVDVMVGARIPAKFRSTAKQPVEYAVPRNATIVKLKSNYINTYLNTPEWEIRPLTTEATPTPTPTPTPVPSASPTPTAAPSATPKPAPVDGLLPLLAIGIAGAGIAFGCGRRKPK